MEAKLISDSDRNVVRLRAKRLVVREEAGMTVAPPIFRAFLEHKFSEK
jgi:hypothetical protein